MVDERLTLQPADIREVAAYEGSRELIGCKIGEGDSESFDETKRKSHCSETLLALWFMSALALQSARKQAD